MAVNRHAERSSRTRRRSDRHRMLGANGVRAGSARVLGTLSQQASTAQVDLSESFVALFTGPRKTIGSAIRPIILSANALSTVRDSGRSTGGTTGFPPSGRNFVIRWANALPLGDFRL